MSKQTTSTNDQFDSLLTKPQLYSIYDQAALNEESDDPNDSSVNIYAKLGENISRSQSHIDTLKSTTPVKKQSNIVKLIYLVIKLSILGGLGIVYNLIGTHIHDNHILVEELASKPLELGYKVMNNYIFKDAVPSYGVYAIEGVFFGTVLPIIDHLRGESQNVDVSFMDNGSILRAGIAFLGVAFGVRKIEWNSSFQASVAWTLLSPCLWLLLDASISGFITSLVLATIGGLSVVLCDIGFPNGWYQDSEFIAVILWLGNFLFFGLVIFGKIGRYLFN